MLEKRSFRDHCLVACAILHPELSRLQEEGFLDAKKVFYIPAGLHIKTERLEERLTAQLQKALMICPPEKIIVVQGAKCFISTDDPYRRIDDIIREQAPGIRRVQADYGYDMLAGKEEREEIAVGGGDPDSVVHSGLAQELEDDLPTVRRLGPSRRQRQFPWLL